MEFRSFQMIYMYSGPKTPKEDPGKRIHPPLPHTHTHTHTHTPYQNKKSRLHMWICLSVIFIFYTGLNEANFVFLEKNIFQRDKYVFNSKIISSQNARLCRQRLVLNDTCR
jgi:hypothetical protein